MEPYAKYGTQYLRIYQAKCFKDCRCPQILLGSFLNTLTHMRNEENIGHIARGSEITRLSLTYKMPIAT